METKPRYSPLLLGLELLCFLLGLAFLMPFYFLIINSFKKLGAILLNAASLPDSWGFGNFKRAWVAIDFPVVFMHSFVITSLSVGCLVVAASMTAYRLVRKPTTFNKLLFTIFVAAMIIPFQSVMLPLMRITSLFELRGHVYGIVICYIGFGISLSVFLFHGFIKSVPLEIEEAAVVDGCTPYGLYWRVVFPLLKPISVTVIILNVLWIWNDYLLPVLVINDAFTTIPLAVQKFFGQYLRKWDLAMASLTLSTLPVIVFFLFLQKHIIEGITAGSVKG
ncbi:carbohydrate ABC transporter permease [Paenibacillus sacheonensis]|uniref:ABC transporter permease subunit n=1 Tax=Paenibacillus sacheonensis TaxID=742054 RepID=A0A7X4YLQ7_9BACL|nr:carbohydrate ABC transporter permease [Paenibacillus sacheonensis]MBM7565997.1 raffinose/stachyose/melibiose transport system permease protein [Paenibacillus sacheonensis]NBC68690.1 ABC transporter permease subunit [Paenibacillus sacheonensis]